MMDHPPLPQAPMDNTVVAGDTLPSTGSSLAIVRKQRKSSLCHNDNNSNNSNRSTSGHHIILFSCYVFHHCLFVWSCLCCCLFMSPANIMATFVVIDPNDDSSHDMHFHEYHNNDNNNNNNNIRGDDHHRRDVAWESIIISETNHTEMVHNINQNDDHDHDNHHHQLQYGADISWPMQHAVANIEFNHNDSSTTTTTTLSPLHIFQQHRSRVYSNFMQGCYDRYDVETCNIHDQARRDMNLHQPSTMINYTIAGYAKLRAPTIVMDILSRIWDNHHEDGISRENWGRADIYTNHWDVYSQVIPLNTYLKEPEENEQEEENEHDHHEHNNSIVSDRQRLIAACQAVLEVWSGQSLELTSLYGIRIYYGGSILSPHVDRNPLITSAIINVAQDVDEPWPLEVIGHDGMARNITMIPGDMVLYESHSIIHGRPYAMEGRYMANVFIHFEPMGFSQRIGYDPAHDADDDEEEEEEEGEETEEIEEVVADGDREEEYAESHEGTWNDEMEGEVVPADEVVVSQ
jgi:hypothetical protein